LDNYLLIDIRDIRELWKSGTVKGARHIPRGMLEFWLDPESPYFKSDLKVETVKILYCASNWRSALASKTLMEMGFTNVMHVKGGFQALIDAGFSIQKVEQK
jgi:rhodanese-related sulfurtransferase